MFLVFIGRGQVPSETDVLVAEKFDWGVLLGSLSVEGNGREGSRISQREKLICEAVLVSASVDPTWKFMLRWKFRVVSSQGPLARSVLRKELILVCVR